MATNIHKTQPNVVFFDLEFGGLRQIYSPPEITVELSIILQPFTGRFTCTLFDDTGYAVEPHLWSEASSGVPGGFLQWGYKGENNTSSGRIPCLVESYKPVIGRNYFSLALEGKLTDVPSDYNSGGFNGTLERVVEEFGSKYNLTLDLKDPVSSSSLLGFSQDKTTEMREKEFHKQATETDTAFLARILERYGISKASDKVGYWAMVSADDDGTGGTSLRLRLTNREFAQNKYEWTVQDPDSVVIEWSPELNFISERSDRW